MRAVVFGLVFGTACYTPTPPAGAPCADGVCPSGLVCAPATQRCEHPGRDGGVDPAIDATDAASFACFGSGLGRVCLFDEPTQVLTAGTTSLLDTDTSPFCMAYVGEPSASAAPWCVIAGSSVTIDHPVDVTGSRPLVIVSSTTMEVTAKLDAASHRGGTTGPGANGAMCPVLAAAATEDGGAGGSFGGRGGAGGDSGSGGSPAAGPVVPTALRGGCAGGNAHAVFVGGGAKAGAGGGAVYLIARTSIDITASAVIDASGAGGDGASISNGGGGGGGGGSGGLVGLDAPAITIAGAVFANGGGGGGGSRAGNGSATNGEDPQMPLMAARGGSPGCGPCGRGGDGSVGTMRTGIDGSSTINSGGGGGGGAGVILIVPLQAVGGTLSPPPS